MNCAKKVLASFSHLIKTEQDEASRIEAFYRSLGVFSKEGKKRFLSREVKEDFPHRDSKGPWKGKFLLVFGGLRGE